MPSFSKAKKKRSRDKQRYRDNQEEICKKAKTAYEAKDEKCKEGFKKYYSENCERSKKIARLSYQANPEKSRRPQYQLTKKILKSI